MSDVAAANPPKDKTFFGHPRGLSTLFFTEMWERFSYYGMRAFLVLYIAADKDIGGLGETKKTAGIIYAMYGSLIYLMSLPGGWVADRFLGQRKAVLFGGVIIMLGHITLALPTHDAFYLGLGFIILGTGLLKPNVSTIVGQLYDKNDLRRDAGYSIYYMGINLGALVAPFACGFLAKSDTFRGFLADHGIDPNISWHLGFGAAAVGMAFGIIQFMYGSRFLGEAGAHKPRPKDSPRLNLPPMALGIIGATVALIAGFATWRLSGTIDKPAVADSFGVGLLLLSITTFVILHRYVAQNDDERRRIRAMAVLYFGCAAFFGIFEQAGLTLDFYAEENVSKHLFFVEFDATYYQGVNPAWVLILAPVFTALWLSLRAKRKEPTSVGKFSIGMVISAVAFLSLFPAIAPIAHHEKVSGYYLILYYMLSTCGEMCVSPVGLSTMNRLAPERLASFVMGMWFMATAVGIYIAGRAEHEVGGWAAKIDFEMLGLNQSGGLFYLLMIFALAAAAILYAFAGPVKRMLEQGHVPVAKAKR